MASQREAIRMTVTPNTEENMNDEKRYVPLKNLIGPFTFPLQYFQRRLQIGNQCFGDFAAYESNSFKRATSFNHKRLLDVFVRVFEKLFYQPEESKRKLEARYAYCLVRTTDRQDHSMWIRDQIDLADSYDKVESFVFFIEVCRRANEEEPGENLDFSDLDDIIEETFLDVGMDRRSTGDEQEIKRRKTLATKLHASYNCQQPNVYDCTSESCDLSTFMNPVDFGRVLLAVGVPITVSANRDSKVRLGELDYAPSKVFDAYGVYMRSVEEGSLETERLPSEFIVYHEETEQMCLDLCAGLSFDLEPPQIRLELFRYLGFPDVRQTNQPDVVPYPDEATLLRAAGLELDNTVQMKGVSGFARARDKLALGLRRLEDRLPAEVHMEAARNARLDWQKRALIVYKSMVYGPRSAVGKSVKRMIKELEIETEQERRCGSVGIEVAPVDLIVYPNLDAQQNYLA